ncbi:GNAT family N-acetyltransferase [Aeromonas jandaei]|uniref:GNAT family N-acetyltransferase n=1 Tax=Aeromonas jandaei TaxID=650 RepID=A0ABD7EU40_AERJA|nr:GNAT family N-acetyltransferase [Aeromonas jandaei]MBL0599323.1 GNAT family N-acetyltransferase [Aeromonas jandaei]MBW3806741.1 GNAT family N-acetyltransferase [Aeromonas jandaei]QSR71542.1 GNAT family N-acetyltransferase [Aeromonas jandaei]QWL64509.1 GNAT family N-acetyltransferase [Aeromonas jandaei]BCS50155.1 acetyltransferase [Aeromonas jandaei]
MSITIRHAEPADAPALRDLHAMPNAQAGTLQLPYPALGVWQQRLEQSGAVALVAEVEGLLVGQIVLHVEPNPRRKHVAGIGMGVRDDWAGKGVGSALMAAALDLADNWLNLHRIELTVFVDNEAALALYRKFGFVEEGRARDYAFRQGRYVDVFYMARVAGGASR